MSTSTNSEDQTTIRLPFSASHAFIVGINNYTHLSPLSTAVRDAEVLAQTLERDHGYQVHPPLLNASRADLVDLLEHILPKTVGPDDRVLFYFAGHGIALDSDDDPKGYLVPVDAQPGDNTSLLAMDQLHQRLTGLPCQHGMIILDCCFAGAFKWSTGFRDVVFDLPGIIYEERLYQYAQDPAWQVITSSASDQKAVDILSNRTLGMRDEDTSQHSPFAQALLDGLAGEADTVPKERGDGVITATELYTYLRDRVEDETTAQGKRQSPAMFSLQKHNKGQYIFLHPRHPLNLPPIPDHNPFMGLKSYDEADNSLFYGRDRVIATLDKLVKKQPLTVVSGASGTGKSSVIKAGLLPNLRKQNWQILPIIRPGKYPLESIRESLPQGLPKLEQPTLLIIDQYEELLTQTLYEEERLQFETQLNHWLNSYPNLHIIISIRSDFEPQFEEGPLKQWWQVGRYVVPAFSQDELREVIIKPTVQEVLFFEPDSLVDKLVDEVNQAPGALPLLSFTLSELYHAYLNSGRTNRAFTLEDYEKLGGVIGALRTRANSIYDDLSATHQHSMRKLMLRMVSLEGGELASRRVLSEDLVFSDLIATQHSQEVAQKLVAARLVSTGRDQQGRTYYEPAHDALVRAWARLWEWIKVQGEGKLSLMYKLSLAVADYQINGGRAYLWHDDPRLDLLYADLLEQDHNYNAPEERFLRESFALRKRNQRRRWGIIAGVIIGLAGLAIYALIQQGVANTKTQEALEAQAYAQTQRDTADIRAQEARDSAAVAQTQRNIAQEKTAEALESARIANEQRARAERQLRISEANSLGLEANIAYNGNYFADAFRSSLLSFAKMPGEPSPELKQMLGRSFQKLWGEFNYFPHATLTHEADVEQLFLSPSETQILVLTKDNMLHLWERRGAQYQLKHKTQVSTNEITQVVFSPDEKKALIISYFSQPCILDLVTQQLQHLASKISSSYLSAALLADQETLLFYPSYPNDGLHQSSAIEYWDFNGNTLGQIRGERVMVSLDYQVILSATEEDVHLRTLYGTILDTETWPQARSAVIGAEGYQYVVKSEDGQMLWYNAATGHRMEFPKELKAGATFTPDGRHLFLNTTYEQFKYNEHGELVSRDSSYRFWIDEFSPDGKWLAGVSNIGGAGISLYGPTIFSTQVGFEQNELNFSTSAKGDFSQDIRFISNEHVLVLSEGHDEAGYVDIFGVNGQKFPIDERSGGAIGIHEFAVNKRRSVIINSAGLITDFTGQPIMQLSLTNKELYWSQFLEQSDGLLTVSDQVKNTIQVWRLLTRSTIASSKDMPNQLLEDSVRYMLCSPKGDMLVFHLEDQLVLRNLRTGEQNTFQYPASHYSNNTSYENQYQVNHYGSFSPGHFSADNRFYMTFNQHAGVWILASDVPGSGQYFWGLRAWAFSPTQSEICVLYADGMMERWKWDEAGQLTRVPNSEMGTFTREIEHIDYAEDGQHLIFSTGRFSHVDWSVLVDITDRNARNIPGKLMTTNANYILTKDQTDYRNPVYYLARWKNRQVDTIREIGANYPYKDTYGPELFYPVFTADEQLLEIPTGLKFRRDGSFMDSLAIRVASTFPDDGFFQLANDVYLIEELVNAGGAHSLYLVQLFDAQQNCHLYTKSEASRDKHWTADRTQLLVAYSKQAELWDLNKKELVSTFQHEAFIDEVQLSAKAKFILTSDVQGGVRLWNRAGELLLELQLAEPIKGLAFHSDNKSFYTLTSSGTVQHWLAPKNIYQEYKYLLK